MSTKTEGGTTTIWRRMRGGVALALVLALFAPSGQACSVFAVQEGDAVLVGNNEDWPGIGARVWARPARGDHLGFLYFGFSEEQPQGGVNAAGVVFDALGLPDAPAPVAKDGERATGAEPLFRMLGSCHSAEEAVRYLTSLEWDCLRNAQVFVADRSGFAAVVGPGGTVTARGEKLIATNLPATASMEWRRSCARYRLIEEALGGAGALEGRCRIALAAAHQEGEGGGTQYSMIYDLRAMTVEVFWFHDFTRSRTIDIVQWLGEPARSEALAEYIGETFAAQEMRRHAMAGEASGAWIFRWLLLSAAAATATALAVCDLLERRRWLAWWRPAALALVVLAIQPLLLALPWLELARSLNLAAPDLDGVRAVSFCVAAAAGVTLLVNAGWRLCRLQGNWPRALVGGLLALAVAASALVLGPR
jgi:hypothetical protein